MTLIDNAFVLQGVLLSEQCILVHTGNPLIESPAIHNAKSKVELPYQQLSIPLQQTSDQ